jgi:UDP-3-O-[3-hydroxymyristoyl] glucosamine N-acyltransferase
VVLTGGVTDVNWAVGSSATLGETSTIQGIVNAIESITVGSGASIEGRAWALNGAVTLDDNATNL